MGAADPLQQGRGHFRLRSNSVWALGLLLSLGRARDEHEARMAPNPGLPPDSSRPWSRPGSCLLFPSVVDGLPHPPPQDADIGAGVHLSPLTSGLGP